jgi:5-methylcytosine-specific restriction endonuclease McrA
MAIDRKALYERCKGYCEKCGGALPEGWAAHHRKLRSQGGKDTLDNVVALHHECHNLGTKSVHLNPKQSYEDGFMVKSWANPDEMPLNLALCRLVTLTKDGQYKEVKDIDGPKSNN